ncbi:MAG: hypothetical protein M0Z57_00845 [Deltaproteobacteria bacterium]|jgi:hypothetical protein|nr:hypothetical protein [Deltaproteobacteria bacterium]
MELNLWNKTAFQPERQTINSAAKNGSLDIRNLNQNNKDIIKERAISKGENEIKALLNSGFIVKNSENFLLNTYGFIDKDVKSNFNDLFLKNSFVEVQGASFSSMTPYGRNITVKNIIMSSEKFNDINSAKYAGNYAKHDRKFNEEYKLSKFTLENYFDLKQKIPRIKPDIAIGAKNAAPGIINLTDNASGKLSQIRYSITETPSAYKFKKDYADAGEEFGKNPSLGRLKEYKDTLDGFKNLKVTVNDKKILEIESIHNWQKIMHYVKIRDMEFLNGLRDYEKGEIAGRIEIHHINQLQDDGRENVANLIALSDDKHRLADAYKVLIDKNTGYYREKYFENTSGLRRFNSDSADNISKDGEDRNDGKLMIYNKEIMQKLLTDISKLDLNDKIMLNDIKLDIESNTSMRLAMLKDTKEDMKLLFIDRKTGEELRLLALKTEDAAEKSVSKTALINFIGDLATSTIKR